MTRAEFFAKLRAAVPGIWNKPGAIAEGDQLYEAMQAAPSSHSLSDAAAFYGQVRGITGPLDQAQVDSITEILRAVAHWPLGWVAYALATAWHESRLLPIREMGGDAYLSKYDTGWLAKVLGNTPERDGDGIKYAGRGFVQLTGKANYRKAGEALGIDLLAEPNLALSIGHAARILAWGMEGGHFTGKALRHYITDARGTEGQFQSARRIINGTDKSALIAGYAMRFQSALQAGGWG